MSNLSKGLCGKVARSVVWYTFSPLDSDLPSPLNKVIRPWNNWGLVKCRIHKYFQNLKNVSLSCNLISSQAYIAMWKQSDICQRDVIQHGLFMFPKFTINHV